MMRYLFRESSLNSLSRDNQSYQKDYYKFNMILSILNEQVSTQRILTVNQFIKQSVRMFFVLVAIVITWVFTFVKSHQIVHFKSVHFSLCELYLNFKRACW